GRIMTRLRDCERMQVQPVGLAVLGQFAGLTPFRRREIEMSPVEARRLIASARGRDQEPSESRARPAPETPPQRPKGAQAWEALDSASGVAVPVDAAAPRPGTNPGSVATPRNACVPWFQQRLAVGAWSPELIGQ